MEYGAIVLAGGRGLRFKRQKQFEKIGQKEMWRYVYDKASQVIDKNNIVSGIYKEKYQTINFPVIGNNTSYLYEKDRIKYEYNQEQARQILESAEWNLQKKTWQKIITRL